MKKNLLLLLVFVSMIPAVALSQGMMQRKQLPGKIDTLLINYFNYSKFTSFDESGFSDFIASKFEKLFSHTAQITDEVNPSFYDKDFDHPFNLPIRAVDEYIAKTKENYPYGVYPKYNAIQVDYAALIILMLKETNGTTKTGLQYKIIDTLKLELKASPDFKTITIENATVMGYTIFLSNDDDRDFIPNGLDKCPKEQGFRTVNGCLTKEEKVAIAQAKRDASKVPVKDTTPVVAKKEKKIKEKPVDDGPTLPGLYLGLTVSGGNNSLEVPFNGTNVSYDQQLKGSKNVNNITGIKLTKQAPFTQVQMDVDYYFGKKKKIGIATGIGYSGFNASIAMDSFHVEYRATDSKNNVYRRLVTARAIDEDLKIKSINIPFLLQFKFDLGDKANLTFGFGAVYHSVLSAKVSGTAKADYEAVYNFGVPAGNTTTYDTSLVPSGDSWLITRGNVEAHNGKIGEKKYFNDYRADGYDVAIEEALSKESSLSLGSSLGAIVRINANLKLSEKLWFATLLQFQSVTFTNGSFQKNYMLTNEIGSYNVLMNNVSTLKTGSLSLGIGFKFTIK